jgi:hypothetical protein
MPASAGMTDSVSSFPIPDFDSEIETESAGPVFKEISFDDSTESDKPVPEFETLFDSGVIPENREAIYPGPGKDREIEKKLNSLGFETSTDGDIIIASRLMPHAARFAVAVHDDSDFTIADNDNWFAAGKQKPSPIAAALAAAGKHDASPILYLATENIMDLDNMKKNWSDMGVRTITDFSEL